ncbi:MAG TPA: methyltransferase domain-containing protein [Aliidongia sp.]|nr:methyltransferase domain-containing protein [Aliidongia sp.]
MHHFLDRPVGWAPPDFAQIYDETSLWSARFGALLFEHLEIRRGIRGLDVGCGTGFPLIELAQLHGPSSHFTGIDVWGEALERARLKCRSLGLCNLDLIEADAAAMPFHDGTFDLVVSNIGVNNFADPAAALGECRRVAKTGARLVLTTNQRGHFAALYRLLDGILGELGLAEARAALQHEEAHRHSKETLGRLLGNSGFAVARSFEQDFTFRFADGSAMLRHSLVKWFLDGWRQAIGAEHEHRVFDLVEARLNAASSPVEMAVPMLYIEAIAR